MKITGKLAEKIMETLEEKLTEAGEINYYDDDAADALKEIGDDCGWYRGAGWYESESRILISK